MSTRCIGTTSRSCSLNFPSWTFSVHSWASGQQGDEGRPCPGTLDPDAPTPRPGADLRPELGPGRPVLVWPGSQNPLPHDQVQGCRLSQPQVRSGHTRTAIRGLAPTGPASTPSGSWLTLGGPPAEPGAPPHCLDTGHRRTAEQRAPAPGPTLDTGSDGNPAGEQPGTPRRGTRTGS